MIPAGRVGGHGQALHRQARARRAPSSAAAFASIAPQRPARRQPGARGVCPASSAGRDRPAARPRSAEGRPDLEQRGSPAVRARRCGRRPAPGWRPGWAASGRGRTRSGSEPQRRVASPPNSAACALRHEAERHALQQPGRRQRAPGQRGADLARRQRRRRHRRGTAAARPAAPRRGRAGAAPPRPGPPPAPRRRSRPAAAATRLAAEARRLVEQRSARRCRCARTARRPSRLRVARSCTAKPSRSSAATASSAGTASAAEGLAAARSAGWRVRCQAGSAPAATTSLASPPHRSMDHRVSPPRARPAAGPGRRRARSAGGRRR